ncbi:protein phosphatase 1 regulatory subunit 32-like [Actinia tenebrosa]|uniref:Protein phosphatase 1 regulatory subunit 32-like n=1 Tax=Actinia tenebrosa TaxID=6105 RepID=A0A6P8HM15_ACTTE|nr:protein phosphatase 1 regulatory subunit 32-like [Actinia tenebrosa]XP_031556029.1 protein phosphatase 1 regulatory subunit 32-like [Actinia tenebrosa]
MGRLPYGPGNPHILQSKGADKGVMKFYCTEYSTHYGQEGFNPRTGKHVGTGYQSNFRPGVYYSRKLDELDNPAMGKIVSDNYASITKKHFLPSKGSQGFDPFSRGLHMTATSGFVKDIPGNLPKSHQVASVHIDTRRQGTVYPAHRPLLHTLNQKDPIQRENAFHGPLYMSTEARTRFLGLPSERMNTSCKTVGHKEGSGFTHAYNDEPVLFNPMEAYEGLKDPRFTSRPTGYSVMKGSFRPVEYQHGNEEFPILSHASDRNTGFTHGTKVKPVFYMKLNDAYTKQDDLHPRIQQRVQKIDPCEYSNIIKPYTYSSTSKLAFRGKQCNDPSEAARLGNTSIGNKEPTGYSENNDKFFETAETEELLRRFDTHYNAKLYNMNPAGDARMGHTRGNLQTQLPDGFTKSTSVHKFGPDINTTVQLRGQKPYQARSIKARDPFFDDHTYDKKLHTTQAITA